MAQDFIYIKKRYNLNLETKESVQNVKTRTCWSGKRSRDRRDRQMSRQRQADSEEISVAAMTGESEVSQSGVGLAKCHSDHLKVKDTHTHTQSQGGRTEKEKVALRVPLSNFLHVGTFRMELRGGAPGCSANINILMLPLMGTS